MAGLSVEFQKLGNYVIDPNAVSGGTTSLFSYAVAITQGASYIANVTIQVATLSVDLRGNKEGAGTFPFLDDVYSNGEKLAKGDGNPMSDLQGLQNQPWLGNSRIKVAPISVVPGGAIKVGGQQVFGSYQVTFLTNIITASMG